MALLLPGISVTYNGEEIGMIDTPINTTDPSRFRDPVRSPFQWDNSTSAGEENLTIRIECANINFSKNFKELLS